MQEVTFDLQTITPLFLAGADQQTAELRPPSFRGVMRYWLRASVGGVVGAGSDGIEKVAEIEKAVFGATDAGSPIQVRVQHGQIIPRPFVKEGHSRATATGRDYLLWSVAGRRPQISPLTPFRVILTARHTDIYKTQDTMRKAISAFWLLTHLGGIGSRSRRCAGSCSVTKSEGNVFDFPFQVPATVHDLQEQLQQGICQSQDLYRGEYTDVSWKPSFDILRQDVCHVWILLNNNHPWQDRDQALRDIGEKLQNYRNKLPLEKRKIFGLPVMVLEHGKATRYSIKAGAGHGYRRLASPLHLRLTELRQGQKRQYVGIATLFKTMWENMSEADYALYLYIENWIKQEFVTAKQVIYDAK